MGTKAQSYILKKELESLGKAAIKRYSILESIGIKSTMEYIDHEPSKEEIEQGFVVLYRIDNHKYARYVYEEEVSDEEYEKILLAYNNKLDQNDQTKDNKVYAVKNGWVTFMGIILLISLIVEFIFAIRIANIL